MRAKTDKKRDFTEVMEAIGREIRELPGIYDQLLAQVKDLEKHEYKGLLLRIKRILFDMKIPSVKRLRVEVDKIREERPVRKRKASHEQIKQLRPRKPKAP